MPHHLMNLRHVPDDEADEIRALFEEHGVRYYETPPSRWGISMGGFWVHDAKRRSEPRRCWMSISVSVSRGSARPMSKAWPAAKSVASAPCFDVIRCGLWRPAWPSLQLRQSAYCPLFE